MSCIRFLLGSRHAIRLKLFKNCRATATDHVDQLCTEWRYTLAKHLALRIRELDDLELGIVLLHLFQRSRILFLLLGDDEGLQLVSHLFEHGLVFVTQTVPEVGIGDDCGGVLDIPRVDQVSRHFVELGALNEERRVHLRLNHVHLQATVDLPPRQRHGVGAIELELLDQDR